MSDAYDSPWKGALDAYFQDFLALLFPEAHQGIDWEKDYKSLDTELQTLALDHKLGRRTVDKLVEVTHRDGKKSLILVHVEVQAQRDSRFEQRMFVYTQERLSAEADRVAAENPVSGVFRHPVDNQPGG